jgi:hypothetical protein
MDPTTTPANHAAITGFVTSTETDKQFTMAIVMDRPAPDGRAIDKIWTFFDRHANPPRPDGTPAQHRRAICLACKMTWKNGLLGTAREHVLSLKCKTLLVLPPVEFRLLKEWVADYLSNCTLFLSLPVPDSFVILFV